MTRFEKDLLQDITRQILIGHQFAQMLIHIIRIHMDNFAGFVGGFQRNNLKQTLHNRIQTPGADIFGGFIYLPCDFSNPSDTGLCEREL